MCQMCHLNCSERRAGKMGIRVGSTVPKTKYPNIVRVLGQRVSCVCVCVCSDTVCVYVCDRDTVCVCVSVCLSVCVCRRTSAYYKNFMRAVTSSARRIRDAGGIQNKGLGR
jgi:hypothetical protein